MQEPRRTRRGYSKVILVFRVIIVRHLERVGHLRLTTRGQSVMVVNAHTGWTRRRKRKEGSHHEADYFTGDCCGSGDNLYADSCEH